MTSEAPHRAVRGARRFRGWIRQHAVLNTTWRIAVFVVGVAVALGGLIMLVTPGPGWLAIIAGFALLATEFGWARRALRRAKDAGQAAKEKALDPRVRRRNKVLLIIACVVVAAVVVAYVVGYGWTPPWKLAIWHRLP
ncbi:MAG TPA: PGPGW domain-containing protein [Streptosporangiales bacterium]